VDEMLRGPFRVFVHHHGFEPIEPGHCRMVDRITYAFGRDWWGRIISETFVRIYLLAMFRWRHYRTRRWAQRLRKP
jgi:ligand-binding SRPBCC domain-containing protein